MEKTESGHSRATTHGPSLLVAWSTDAGDLGARTIAYLKEKLKGEYVEELEPTLYFPLEGVSIEDDVAHFPVSRFYKCEGRGHLLFESDTPRWNWHEFLSTVLDVAIRYEAKDIYTVGGIISFSAHTMPGEILAIVNSPELKVGLAEHGVSTNLNYETQAGGRPTISSFLLWVARRRGIPGTSIWAPIPFYLASTEDLGACKRVVQFLDRKLDLGIDLLELDRMEASHNQRLAEALSGFPEVEGYVQRLEANLSLTEEESETLVRVVQEALKRKGQPQA
jgi:proteasome assembly chaperone (PAC2) family protein